MDNRVTRRQVFWTLAGATGAAAVTPDAAADAAPDAAPDAAADDAADGSSASTACWPEARCACSATSTLRNSSDHGIETAIDVGDLGRDAGREVRQQERRDVADIVDRHVAA